MNNLRKFATEAEYSAATLNYPAVSWVVSGDTVHYDKEAAPVANDKVMVYAYTTQGSDDLILWNEAATPNFTSITVNDTEVPNPNSTYRLDDVGRGTFLVKYGFDSTVIGDWFTGDIGGMSSGIIEIEVLIPSKITNIAYYPENITKMVVEAETPPYVEGLGSSFDGDGIYVPDSAVNTYKSASEWSSKEEIIFPISEYQGNLPV